jgi:hypothetical protein
VNDGDCTREGERRTNLAVLSIDHVGVNSDDDSYLVYGLDLEPRTWQLDFWSLGDAYGDRWRDEWSYYENAGEYCIQYRHEVTTQVAADASFRREHRRWHLASADCRLVPDEDLVCASYVVIEAQREPLTEGCCDFD